MFLTKGSVLAISVNLTSLPINSKVNLLPQIGMLILSVLIPSVQPYIEEKKILVCSGSSVH